MVLDTRGDCVTPTVIDSLIIELGIDPKKLTGGEQQFRAALRRMISEASRGAKQTESETKKIGNQISELKREAIGLTSLFLGGKGIREFTNYVTNLDAQTGRLATSLGESAQTLSAWQGVAKGLGGSAETITGAIGGLNSELVRFSLTGQGSFLPLLNFLKVSQSKNGELKTTTQLLLDIAEAMETVSDKRKAAGLMSMIPGMNQDTINMLMVGRKELEQRLAKAARTGGPTQESIDAAEKYQKATADFDRSATALGRTFSTLVIPTLVKVMDKVGQLFDWWQNGGSGITDQERHKALRQQFGEPPAWLKNLTGEGNAPATPDRKPGPTGKPIAGQASPAEMEAYIRKAAVRRGIDPNIAAAVARAEGLYDYVGDKGSSFGPFQLHYGGMAPGGNAVSGLGDVFTKRTGLHARDPSTWPQQVDFTLDEVRKNGWGAWHGWKGLPRAGIGTIPSAGAVAGATPGSTGGSTQTSNVSVQQLTVNTQATDGEGVARDIVPALKRLTMTAQANAGAQ